MKFMWIIQDSQGKHYNWTELYRAVNTSGSSAIYMTISQLTEMQLFGDCFPIVIGGDDFLDKALDVKALRNGVFNDENFFRVDSYIRIWRERYLNCDSLLIFPNEVSQYANLGYFCRPLYDVKCFDGQIVTDKLNLERLCEFCCHRGERCVCISSTKNIKKEWRAVIVDNEPVSICRYLKDGVRTVSSTDIPDSLVSFCSEYCKYEHSPIAWVMDIALVSNKYFLLECNIFNASNFYDCNRTLIVKSLENSLQKKYSFYQIKGRNI